MPLNGAQAIIKAWAHNISYSRVGAIGPVTASADRLDRECVSFLELYIVWDWRLTAY